MAFMRISPEVWPKVLPSSRVVSAHVVCASQDTLPPACMPQVAAQLQKVNKVKQEVAQVKAQIAEVDTADPAPRVALEERLTELEHQETVHSQLIIQLLQQCAGERAAPVCSRFRALAVQGKGFPFHLAITCRCILGSTRRWRQLQRCHPSVGLQR